MQSYDGHNPNGEVQTNEKAIVYVKELDLFLAIKYRKHARQYCR